MSHVKVGVVFAAISLWVSASAFGDGILAPAVRGTGALTLEVAQGIALRQVTSEAQAARLLGTGPQAAAQACSLWALIKTLESQGGLASDASKWAEFRQMVETQDSDQVLAWLKHHADTRTPLSATALARFTGQAQASRDLSSSVSESPEETFLKYVPKSQLTQQLKEGLLATAGRSTQLRIQVIGKILQAAEQTPKICSAQAKDYCASAAKEAVLLWAAENFDQAGELAQTFILEVLAGFPHETESYVGRGEVTLQGFIAAVRMGKNRPERLNNCLWRGSPSLN